MAEVGSSNCGFASFFPYPEVKFIEVHWHTGLNWHVRVETYLSYLYLILYCAILLPSWFIGNNSKHFGSLI